MPRLNHLLKMKQIFNVKGKATIKDVPVPICSQGEVLVENIYSGISTGTELKSLSPGSGSMLSMAMNRKDLVQFAVKKAKKEGILKTYKFAKSMMDNWWPLGYSCVGKVIEVGTGISDLKPGNIVACAGQDIASHAEFVVVPRNLVAKVPEGTDLKQAAFTTVGATVIHSIHRAGCQFGETIVVYGLGLLGQITARILSAIGCKVIGIDIDSSKVDSVPLHLGVSSANPVDEVMNYTNHVGADAVIITAKSENRDIVNNAMNICRKKGKIVVVGHVKLDFDRKPFYEKELDVLISRSYGPGRHDPLYEKKGLDYPIEHVRWTIRRNMETFLDLVHDKKIDISSIIGNEVDIENAEAVYQQLPEKSKKPLLTALIRYPEAKSKEKQCRKIIISPSSKPKEKYGVAIIGTGSFARDVHIPLLKNHPRFYIKTLLSKTGSSAAKVASHYNLPNATSDYDEILNDREINLVVILTPHSEHKNYVIKAINAGKNVFVEKPLATTWQDCIEIAEALEKKPVIFTVGFNRTYSELAESLCSYFKGRKQPLVMSYRIQAKMNKNKEWLYDPEVGGGRIVGELCHAFDFLNWISGSSVKALDAVSIDSENPDVLSESNLSVSLSYSDGSIGSLTYSEQGNLSMPKERIEIICENKIAVIEEFDTLILNGKRTRFKQDKGYEKHYDELIKALDGKKACLVGIDRALSTMQLSFQTLHRIKGVEGRSDSGD